MNIGDVELKSPREYICSVSYPNGPWVAMKASSALWLQPAPCGGRELQRRVCLLAELYA